MYILFVAFLIAELLSAIFGSWYLTKVSVDRPVRYFVYFLWLTILVELVGCIPIFVSKGYLPWLLDTIFRRNHWLYNSYYIISFFFYAWFFRNYVTSKFSRKTIATIIGVFLVTTVANLIFTDVFFKTLSSYTYIYGVLMLTIAVFFYFFEMLQSDKVLNFKYILQFYIAVGVFLFHICVTPLFIYSSYFNHERNPEFVYVYRVILRTAIIALYLFYVLGFVVCSKKRKSY